MKTTDVNPLYDGIFFCRRKTNTGRHLRRHCRMPSRIPMAEGKKCDKNIFSEFLGHFLLECYLDKEIFFLQTSIFL